MKKKGYSLVELLLVIGILIFLSSIGLKVGNSIKGIKEDIYLKSIVYEIRDLLSFGKYICRKNNREGLVYFNEKDSIIILRDNEEKYNVFKRIDIYNGVFIRVNLNYVSENGAGPKNVKIKENGFISNSGTITINNKKEKYEIKIGVGNDFINVKGPYKVGKRYEI